MPFPSHRTTRRDFLKGTAAVAAVAASAGFWVTGRGAWADPLSPVPSPNEKLNLGIIGVSGRASGNLHEEKDAVAGQNLVALCDVDAKNLERVSSEFPK